MRVPDSNRDFSYIRINHKLKTQNAVSDSDKLLVHSNAPIVALYVTDSGNIEILLADGNTVIIDKHIVGDGSDPYRQITKLRMFRKFRHDKCTFFFEGNWEECCIVHDFLYWIGGTSEQRKEADTLLRKCIQLKGGLGNAIVSWLVYFAVRIFGNPNWPGKKTWAWGKEETYSSNRKVVPTNINLLLKTATQAMEFGKSK